MAAKNKKKSGFWRGLMIFIFGFTCGTATIASVAVYVNGLHLPFVKEQEKTHLPGLSSERERNKRESVEFQDLLRQQQPAAVVPEAAPETNEQDSAPSRRFDFYLQIGAFRNQDVAEDLRARMILNGHSTIVNTGTLADGTPLYRVWMGPYGDENDAEEKRAQLALEGYADVQLLQTAR